MKSPTRLFLIRHGEVEERYQGVFAGRIDMALSPRGHDQARLLGRYLDRHRFAALYVSPMMRAQQTVVPLRHLSDQPIISRAELREVDFGCWTGLAWKEVWDKFQVNPSDWLGRLDRGEITGAETGPALRQRVGPFVREVLLRHASQRIAFVCHGGVIRALIALLLDLPLAPLGSIEIEYASLTCVDVHPHRTGLHLLNLTPWRDLS